MFKIKPINKIQVAGLGQEQTLARGRPDAGKL